jgi:hypothetical protein
MPDTAGVPLVPATFWLPQPYWDALRALAEEHGTKVVVVMRDALDAYLATHVR